MSAGPAGVSYEPLPEDEDERAELAEEFANPNTYDAPLDRCMASGCDATSNLAVVRDLQPPETSFEAVLCPTCAKMSLWCMADGCTTATDLAIVTDDSGRDILCPHHAKERMGAGR